MPKLSEHPDAEKAVRGLLKAVEGLDPLTELRLEILTIFRLCERAAKAAKDAAGARALLYEVGPVALLRVLPGEGIPQRVDGFYVGDDDVDEDGEVRLTSKDRLFSLVERPGEQSAFEDVKDMETWFNDVRICLLARIASDKDDAPDADVAGHALQ